MKTNKTESGSQHEKHGKANTTGSGQPKGKSEKRSPKKEKDSEVPKYTRRDYSQDTREDFMEDPCGPG